MPTGAIGWGQVGGLGLVVLALWRLLPVFKDIVAAFTDIKTAITAGNAANANALEKVNDTLVQVRETQSSLLERERMRGERLAAQQAAAAQTASQVAAVQRPVRLRTQPYGQPIVKQSAVELAPQWPDDEDTPITSPAPAPSGLYGPQRGGGG
jgi:hypothetical protein